MGKPSKSHWMMAFYHHWHYCSFKIQSSSWLYPFEPFWERTVQGCLALFFLAIFNSPRSMTSARGDGWRGSSWKTWRHGMQAQNSPSRSKNFSKILRDFRNVQQFMPGFRGRIVKSKEEGKFEARQLFQETFRGKNHGNCLGNSRNTIRFHGVVHPSQIFTHQISW